jgi:hypothetical protein
MHRLFADLLLLATASAISISATAQPSCNACVESRAFLDGASGLCVPASISGFTRSSFAPSQLEALEAFRHTSIAGFNGSAHRLAVTVYVYDREDTSEGGMATEARSAVAEILKSHKGAALAMAGSTSLSVGGQAKSAQGGLFTWKEGADDYASFLWVIPLERRYLKVRATYVRPNGGEGDAMKYANESVRMILSEMCLAKREP